MHAIVSCLKATVLALSLCALTPIGNVRGSITTSQACVQLVATVSEGPNQISLSWQPDSNATSYQISRKLFGAGSWQVVATLDGSATSWTDTDFTLGEAYEYQAIESTAAGYTGYGYICSGIKRGFPENRGKLILLVTKELADALPIELLRLEQDLVGDGWAVLQHTVATTQSVQSVKDLVRADYNADPNNTKALFLFGHVPVPYSGNYTPDGHEDSDMGAWPADVYYGDFDGVWTDTTVSNTIPRHVNIPGDGRFDQSEVPGTVKLQIGRVDLSNLTCFANKTPSRSEIDLARQYLAKDHNWRMGNIVIERRAMVFDRFYAGPEPEPQTATAYRHFPAFFGRDKITQIGAYEYFPTLSTNSYMWTYTTSGGSQYGSDYIGTSDSFAQESPKAIFTSYLGSYFGDWDQESDFLRAPLGTSGSVLTAIYGGQPQWLLHTLAMGEPIGYSALLTQNNKTNGLYPPQLNAGAGCVHIALMGDPTIRMHPALPPRNLQGSADGSGVHLVWTNAVDRGVRGYNVYKASSQFGPFTRLNNSGVVATYQFDDPAGTAQDFYMVRALKLETSPSGSYWNLSQGIFYPDTFNQAASIPTGVTASRIKPGAVVVEWVGSDLGVRAYEIQRRNYPDGQFQTVGTASVNSASFADTSVSAGAYAYRVRALGVTSDSDYSGEAVINLQSPYAGLVRVEKDTGGNWIGRFGSQGYMAPGAGTNWPAYVSMTTSNLTSDVFGRNMTNAVLLQTPDGKSRIWSSWYGEQWQALGLGFRFKDTNVHRVAIYLEDYSNATNHYGTVQLINPFTGALINSVAYTNYFGGWYVVFDLQNYADLRIVGGWQYMPAAIAGIFFDPPSLGTPVISPEGGTFFGSTTLSIVGDAGATVRYTLDGSAPGANSPVYSGPFQLTQSATIKAQAFLSGMASGVTHAAFTNGLVTAVSFVGIDSTTQGDWKKAFGQDGQWIAGGTMAGPSYGSFSANGIYPWTWTDSTTELRAINEYSGGTGRLAAAWYGDQVVADVTLASDEAHPLALYFMDWDGGRTEDVFVYDGSGNLLDQRRISDFGQGKYFVWNVQGHVRFTIKKVSGPNAILNGAFVGTAIATVSNEPPAWDGTAIFSGGNYNLRINGQPGQVVYIQASSDFKTWTDIDRVSISGTSANYSIPVPSDAGMKVFRARLE